MSARNTRQACSFSALNPQESSSMMNQEWYCTSTVIAQSMVVFYFNLRRHNANRVLHQSSSDAIILHDNMSASALDKVVTFEGEVLFERKLRTLTKPEATPGHKVDLRMSRQREEPQRLNIPGQSSDPDEVRRLLWQPGRHVRKGPRGVTLE